MRLRLLFNPLLLVSVVVVEIFILDLSNVTSLDSGKAENILRIPLQGKSSMADYMVIASGTSSRQVAAMAEHVEFKLKQAGVSLLGLEGMRQADWVLLDANDVIVRLLQDNNWSRTWSIRSVTCRGVVQ